MVTQGLAEGKTVELRFSMVTRDLAEGQIVALRLSMVWVSSLPAEGRWCSWYSLKVEPCPQAL